LQGRKALRHQSLVVPEPGLFTQKKKISSCGNTVCRHPNHGTTSRAHDGFNLNISGVDQLSFVNLTIPFGATLHAEKVELLLRQATYLLQLRFQRGTLVRCRGRQLRSKLLPLFLPVTPPVDCGWP
jgi:hypothetical protein